MIPKTRDAYQLLHDGTLALSRAESYGMCVDVPRLKRTIEETADRISELEKQVKESLIWRTWVRRFGQKTTIGSRYQLGVVLFEELEYESKKTTKKGKRAKVDEEVLEGIGLPFVDDYLRLEKLKKLQSTNLRGVEREVVGEFLRPVNNLNFARSFRSSVDTPNFQNIPVRDPEIGKLIRSCFIPRDGRVLVEVDYGGHEFKVAACFWSDPEMVAYASDPSLDIHRDMAAECYLLPVKEIPKAVRFYAKNQFVFPILYGSYYISCARNLWNAMRREKLETSDGILLEEYLHSQGIKELGMCDSRQPPRKGTFERHIRKVEQSFCDKFSTWSQKKEQWWEEYTKTGGFDLLTGFHIDGVFSQNFLYNCPIQGPAFHCLLWSLIQLDKEMRQKKMKSRIVGQIHDSINADVVESELGEYLQIAKRIMTKDIRKHWDWIIVPLEVEAEICVKNWWEKEKVEI